MRKQGLWIAICGVIVSAGLVYAQAHNDSNTSTTEHKSCCCKDMNHDGKMACVGNNKDQATGKSSKDDMAAMQHDSASSKMACAGKDGKMSCCEGKDGKMACMNGKDKNAQKCTMGCCKGHGDNASHASGM